MKNFIKIIISIFIAISIPLAITNAWFVQMENLHWLNQITSVTIDKTWTWDIVKDIEFSWFSLLKNIKIVLEWVLVIFIVYTWANMIMSMWDDEAKITKAKKQIRFSLIAIVFINIPWTIYNTLFLEDSWKNIWHNAWVFTDSQNTNLLINLWLFKNWILSYIVSAIEVAIFTIAIYVTIMAWIKLMRSRWRDEKITEAKQKFLYSLFAILFVWFIEAWKQFAITWNLSLVSWTDWIFGKLINITLLFAGPTVIVFLTYAWYIYITSNWEEEKAKKAKSIVINTLIAIMILLVMVVFLNDLLTLWK